MTVRDLNAARSVGRRDQVEAGPEEAGPSVADASTGVAGGAEIELHLGDLMGDDAGEVVLFNDSSARSLTLLSEVPVVGSGRAERHVTASGANVAGFRFLRFDNGLTIYFEEGLGLIVRGTDRAESF